MTDTPIFDTTPQPVNPQPNLNVDVQAQIDAAVAQVEAKYADRIKALEDQVNQRNPLVGIWTEHAAGPGYEVAETWGLADQERARSEAA